MWWDPEFLLPLGTAAMNDSEVVIDTHANTHKHTHTHTHTHTHPQKTKFRMTRWYRSEQHIVAKFGNFEKLGVNGHNPEVLEVGT